MTKILHFLEQKFIFCWEIDNFRSPINLILRLHALKHKFIWFAISRQKWTVFEWNLGQKLDRLLLWKWDFQILTCIYTLHYYQHISSVFNETYTLIQSPLGRPCKMAKSRQFWWLKEKILTKKSQIFLVSVGPCF